jgi:hypothetical protein
VIPHCGDTLASTREITISPGGSTGWHWHDGKLIGAVKQGTRTHNVSDCSVDGRYNMATQSSNPQAPKICTSDATWVPIQ